MDGLLSLLSPDALAAGTGGGRIGTTSASESPLAGERLARLRLAAAERVGPVTFHEFLHRYGSAAAALAALPELAAEAGLRRPPAVPSAREIAAEAAALGRIGARHLVFGDDDYPVALAALADAPPVLRVRGNTRLLARPLIALVGARNASSAGRRMASDLSRDLGAAGFVVVSGLARGIDTAAHQAALESGTIAVVAGGLDIVYPPENEALHRAIAGAGLLLSEMPLGAVPQARHFPRRNRIISGLCTGVVVVEAALQSGSLITAQRAADQGRDVFAVPGSPLDPRCRGSNRLLKDGARLVECAADILEDLPRHLVAPAAIAPPIGDSEFPAARVGPGPRRTSHDGHETTAPRPIADPGATSAGTSDASVGTSGAMAGLSAWRRLVRAGSSALVRKPRWRRRPDPDGPAAAANDHSGSMARSVSERVSPPPADDETATDLPRPATTTIPPTSLVAVSENRKTVAYTPTAALFSEPERVSAGLSGALRQIDQEPESTTESGSSTVRARVLECLGPGPAAVDEIVRQCQVSAAAVQAILLELELAGRLERHRGNAVSLL